MKPPTFENTSDSFKRRNPHLFGAGELLPEDSKPLPREVRVAGKPARRQARTKSVDRGRPYFRVSIVAFRKQAIDGDNSDYSCKHLRDAIAASLGVDDADRFIQWEYAQCVTRGKPQCAVRIERL